jgi:hypothetical protein
MRNGNVQWARETPIFSNAEHAEMRKGGSSLLSFEYPALLAFDFNVAIKRPAVIRHPSSVIDHP